MAESRKFEHIWDHGMRVFSMNGGWMDYKFSNHSSSWSTQTGQKKSPGFVWEFRDRLLLKYPSVFFLRIFQLALSDNLGENLHIQWCIIFPITIAIWRGTAHFQTHTHILSWKSEHSPNFIIRKPLTDSSPKLAPSGNQAWLAGQSLIFRWCSYISSEALGRFSFHSIAIYPFCIWDFPIWRFPIHGGTPHSSSIYHHISRDSNHFHHVLSHM
jgi:hypothetical protein